MIKLTRANKPVYLTEAKSEELTNEFIASQTSVWNVDEIKIPLMTSSFSKCAYCECDLSKESKYMEVEHFYDKHTYPGKVVEWENLLPSCKRCNGSKSTHDVQELPIINPYEVEPKIHLKLRRYRFSGIDDIGKNTIETVDLNNSERAVFARFQIGEQIHKSIEVAFDRMDRYKENLSTKSKNRLLNMVEEILKEAQPNASYAATTASILHSEPPFIDLIAELESLSLLSPALKRLFESSEKLSLENI